MKNRLVWVGALALASTLISQLESISATTNGMILITTRLEQDLTWGTADSGNINGPGQVSPGDVAMSQLLGDYGYSSRLIIDAELSAVKQNPYTGTFGDQLLYLFPANESNYVSLVINSGSSGSANIGEPNTNGIPIIMGEHSCVANGTRVAHNSLYLYDAPNPSSTGSDDVKNNELDQGPSQYMVVVAPDHPIMQGIPLDANGQVKIFRDPYPEEGVWPTTGAHTPLGGKPNYEYAWTTMRASNAAPGTVIIGLLAGDTNKAVFATADIGAALAPITEPEHPWAIAFGDNKAHQRLVHWFINEQGSGGSRRCFNSLTDIGRVIFIRTVKWALGETLTPYQPIGLIQVSQVNPTQIQLSWTGSATKNYKVLGTRNLLGPADFSNWQTVAQDIKGVDGTVSVKFNMANAPQYAFLRVMPMP